MALSEEMEDEIASLRHKVEMLERQISWLLPILSSFNHPLGPILFVDGAGQEQIPINGSMAAFAGGRNGITTMSAGGNTAVLEVRDGNTYRYVEIGGSGGSDTVGMAQGEVHIMVTDLADDWDLPFLSPIP